MHLIQKKIWCIVFALAMLLLCTSCNAIPLSDRRIVKALFFEHTRAECMVTLLMQQQDEDSDAAVFGRGNSFAEALYSAEENLDGEVFYGTVEIAVFPYESGWEQIEVIGELLYNKVAPIPEISIFQLDKPIEQGNKKLYETQYKKMKETEKKYKFHWGLETLFAEQNECILPFLSDDGYDCVVIDKRGRGNVYTRSGLEAQLFAVLNGHSSKINAEPTEINAAVEADARIEHGRNNNSTQILLIFDDVQWTALEDDTQDRKELERELVNEIESIYKSNQNLFCAQGLDPFHARFYSDIYGGRQQDTILTVVLNNEQGNATNK